MFLAPRLIGREQRSGGPRIEGVSFVGAVLSAASVGWLVNAFLHASDPLPLDPQFFETFVGPTRRGIPWHALLLPMLTGLLYTASALRGARRLPPIVADVLLVLAACALVYFGGVEVTRVRVPFVDSFVALGALAVPLTVASIWLFARMTAALNRTPQVTGGFLGIVALAFLLILKLAGSNDAGADVGANGSAGFFSPALACAALAGAGLASLPLSLKRPNWNLGWSASLALGFWLAHIAVAGLFKNMALAIIGLLLLLFGLPLLDMAFYGWRARGENLDDENSLRLHEALARRGLSPAKIAGLYLAITSALSALGVLVVATATWNLALRLAILAVIGIGGAIFFFSVMRVMMRRMPGEATPESVDAFGVRISAVSMDEAMERIEAMIQSQKPHHVLTSDANSILRARGDEEYASIMRRAALVTPDGYGVIWGARLLNLPIYERVTGIDMAEGICERAARKGYSIYILGSEPGVADTAAQKLSERFPGLRVAGTQHGFYKKEGITDEQIAERIRDAKPDVLFVAFGIPSQEKFIAKWFDVMNVPVSIGVGGSFDVFSENLKRAPQWVQRAGLEWLYRVWQEPWRWKRMGYVPRFMLFALREWIFGSDRDDRKGEKPA